jgi:hypothetical protein
MSGIDHLYARIKNRLVEFDFEPTSKRADGIFYTIMWEFSYSMNNISNDVIDSYIKDVYNFDRYRNTRLAQKMFKNDIIKKTDKWIYVRDYGNKK